MNGYPASPATFLETCPVCQHQFAAFDEKEFDAHMATHRPHQFIATILRAQAEIKRVTEELEAALAEVPDASMRLRVHRLESILMTGQRR